jgi:hypothetical protein
MRVGLAPIRLRGGRRVDNRLHVNDALVFPSIDIEPMSGSHWSFDRRRKFVALR